MTKKKKKKNQDKENQDFIEKKSKSNLPLILSFLAILISLGQLIFTVPLVLKYFDRVEIQAIELGIAKSPNDNNMESSFLIINNGNNTAKNVELHMRILEGDRILFVPESFDLVRGDEKKNIW